MSKHIEKTLVLLKPDTVERGFAGKIITRFEDAGLKIVGMKMARADEKLAKKHYGEDIAKRRGEHIRQYNVDFLVAGPVIAIVLEGINAVENVRKMCGTTEPKSAPPGTIRGDFSHMSFGHCDDAKLAVRNVIHASTSGKEAEYEISIWFDKKELVEYTSLHEKYTR